MCGSPFCLLDIVVIIKISTSHGAFVEIEEKRTYL